MSTISRSITATWWYTFSGVMMFQLLVVFIWTLGLLSTASSPLAAIAIIIGGLVWCASCVPLLLQYRNRDDALGLGAGWRLTVAPIALAIAFGVAAGILSGLWIAAALPIVQSLMLLNWQRGVRVRLVIVVTLALIALWFIDLRAGVIVADDEAARMWGMFGLISVMLPSMTVLSLWWWDVVISLDRARIAEAQLSATQERLRVATDVHDLQGHHLQVIALQLELAERLLDKGQPDAALDQLRLARSSVTEARQGARDLATRFRGVPLPDEIANAIDLLRAAGTTADATVDPQAAQAPASVLGPVIRETTTNVLKHGGGQWARLSLVRDGSTASRSPSGFAAPSRPAAWW
ncbi:histidine kinase [Microbacterium sp. Mu-80]|uniref:Histidine kinase n=1 Tax=Microbacterium bandirmense TaxID=3122050 RepID=A0ABU8LGH5_9MICO